MDERHYLVIGILAIALGGIVYFSSGDDENTVAQTTSSYYETYDDSEEGIAVPFKSRGSTVTIPMEIKGFGFDIVYDTGASASILSKTEFDYMRKKGLVSLYSLTGNTKHFSIADGSTVEAYEIKFDKVKIGKEIELEDVTFYVIDSPSATSLLGQNIMRRFTKHFIERDNGVVRFIE